MFRKLCYDYDFMKYSIAAVCEKRSVIVTHTASGNQKEFDTRTAFWGHWKKKDGGWLAERNKARIEEGKEPWTAEDFTIEDKQVAQPVSHMNQTVKNAIKNINNALGTSRYYGYIGKGDSWRVERSTILEYKGQRKDMIRPLMLDDIESYLKKFHGAEEVRGLEADDQVIIDCMKNPNLILVGVDKDYDGCEPLRFFNPDKMEKEILIQGLGKLYVDEKKKVRGLGRKWFYHQVLSGDDSDNYCANSASDIKWGDKSSYNMLADCQTDAECWQAVVDGYKKLYPEPKTIKGWRGDDINIDWKYVLAENCAMAYMLRTPYDSFNLAATLEQHGVKQ